MNEIAVFDYSALDDATRIVVQQKTSEIRTLGRKVAADIVEMGQKFVEVRDLLRHNKNGGFTGWIEAEGFTKQFVYNCIGVHTVFANSPNFGQFDIAVSALYLLAAPSTPDEAREEALEIAAAGQTISYSDAKQLVTAHKPTNTHPATVRQSSEGVEPDLGEDGEPLAERIERQINDHMAAQVLRDEDYGDDEQIGVGDTVSVQGHLYTVRAVGSKVWLDVSTRHPLYSKGIDFDDVTLVEKRTPPRIQGEEKAAPVLPPTAEETVTLDGVPIAETHPEGFRLFFIETNWATCVNCGESHPRWSAVRGGDWRCDQPDCKRMTADDALIPYTRKDMIEANQPHQRNGNGHKSADPVKVITDDDTNDEWYTPLSIIADVRAFMGDIDVDPATSEFAQRTVKARVYYTKHTDGLAHDWNGRVWLNPPYSYPLVERFTSELLRQYRAGIVEEAIVLVNNRTDAAWFQSLLVEATTVFISGRINFNRPGKDLPGNRQGQAFFYLGNRQAAFSNAFGGYGVVVRCVWEARS